MVFHIVLKHIKRRVDLSGSLQLIVILTISMFLNACGAQDDASAQNPKNSAAQAPVGAKKEAGTASAGQIVFERANCAMCHPGGNNTMDPSHPIKGLEFAKKFSDDSILETTIRKGFPNVGMPSFSKKMIDDHEMRDLIAYVRTLTPAVKTAGPKK